MASQDLWIAFQRLSAAEFVSAAQWLHAFVFDLARAGDTYYQAQWISAIGLLLTIIHD